MEVVTLQRGVRIAVAALDLEGVSKGRVSEAAPPLAVSMVSSTGQPRVLPLTGSGPGRFIYSILLPGNVDIDFKISSSLFTIGDGKGTRVDSQNYRVPVRSQRLQRQSATKYPGNIFRSSDEYDVVVPVRILSVSNLP